MTTSESKGRFFNKTNRFESIRITNQIESIRIVNWNALLGRLRLMANAFDSACKTVESYTVIYAANSHTCYYQFSITHSLFNSRLKTSFLCKSCPLQPFFFFFRIDYMIPQTFTFTSEHIRFYFLVFFVLYFSVVSSARQIKLSSAR